MVVLVIPSLPSPVLVARRTSGASRMRTTFVVGEEDLSAVMVLRKVVWICGREGLVRVNGSGFAPARVTGGRKRDVKPSMNANLWAWAARSRSIPLDRQLSSTPLLFRLVLG